MQKIAEEALADVQMGFWKGIGTRDKIFNLWIIMEKALEASVPLYMAFVDYKKAFDSVKHSVMKSMGLCTTVEALKRLYKDQQAAVKIDSELTDWFQIEKSASGMLDLTTIIQLLLGERVGWWAFLDWNYSERTDDPQPPVRTMQMTSSWLQRRQLHCNNWLIRLTL